MIKRDITNGKKKKELTPGARVGIVNCGVDISQVDFAHEAIDLCWEGDNVKVEFFLRGRKEERGGWGVKREDLHLVVGRS